MLSLRVLALATFAFSSSSSSFPFIAADDSSFDPATSWLFPSTDLPPFPVSTLCVEGNCNMYEPKVFPYIPSPGSYFISNGIPAIDVSNLKYSPKDWYRWDSYTPATSLYVAPTDWSSALSAQGVDSNFIQQYLSVMQHQLDATFYQTGYGYFRGFSVTSFDIYQNLIQSNDFNVENVLNNASYAINQAYNVWRNSELAAGRSTDGETPPTLLPTVQDTVNWLEMYLGAELNVQELTHLTLPRDPPWGPFDQFGLFANQQSLGVGISASAVVFQVAPLGILFSHYVHLFDVPFLRRSRIAFMASYTALYQALLVGGSGAQLSTAQWLTRLAGASMHVNMILQTEKYLRQRGGWNDALDLVTVSDINNGKWTNDDALNFLNPQLDLLVTTTQQYGFTEFNSMYYANDMEAMLQAMLHCPNQVVFNKWETVYKLFWMDVAANYHPGSGTFTGALGRSYDLFSGEHGGMDRMPLRLYIQPLFQPFCEWVDTNTGTTHSACLAATQQAQPASGDFCLAPIQFYWGAWNAAGYGYVPVDVLVKYAINMPYRTVEQRFDVVVGQERFNFISPGYSIAHSGDEYGFVSANAIAVARISGAPNTAYPVNSNTQQTNAVNIIRLMLENVDAPFSHPDSGVPGENLQLIPRQICSQYQSFLLITSLATPGRRVYSMPDDDGTTPLATNLILPLAVDSLYADGVALPRTIGAATVLPKGTILTVRHGGYSIVIRLLYAERSSTSPISDASTISPYSGDPAAIQPNAGRIPYSFMWIVDSQGWAQGSGRIVVVHKHGNGEDISAVGPFRIAWLWAGGETKSDVEMAALQNVVRSAALTNTITATPAAQQRVDEIGNSDPSWQWDVSVNIANQHTLTVQRLDTLSMWGNDPIWAQQGGSGLFPWWTQFNRTVDGQPILTWNKGELAYRVTDNTNNVFAPHLSGNVANVPTDPSTSTSTTTSTTTSTATGTSGTTTPTLPTTPDLTPAASSTGAASSSSSSSTSSTTTKPLITYTAPTPPTTTIVTNPTTAAQPVTPSSNSASATSSSTTIASSGTVDSGQIQTTLTVTFPVPGRVESELFSGWYDTTAQNLGRATPPNRGLYALSPVDLSYSTAASYGYYISFVDDGEWVEYPISVSKASAFTIAARFAQINPVAKQIQFSIDGIAQCTITTLNTQGWENFFMQSCNTGTIQAGLHTLRAFFPSRELNLDYFHFVAYTPTASGSEISNLPGAIPSSGEAVMGLEFSAVKVSVHMLTLLNQTQNNAFVQQFTSQMAEVLGFGQNGATRIEIVEVVPDGHQVVTDSDSDANEEVSSSGTELSSSGTDEIASTSSGSDADTTSTTVSADFSTAASDNPSSSSSSDASTAEDGVNSSSDSSSVDTSSGSADASPSTRRRLLQLATQFTNIPLASTTPGVTVSFLVLPAVIPTASSPPTVDTGSDYSAVTSLLNQACVLGSAQAQLFGADSILSELDCSTPPTVTQVAVSLCPDNLVYETCPPSTAYTPFTSTDPSTTAITPSPYFKINAGGNGDGGGGGNGGIGADSGSAKESFWGANQRTYIVVGFLAFAVFLIASIAVYKVRKWKADGKFNFMVARRRASFDQSSKELQMQGMDQSLVKYRSSYPDPPSSKFRV